MQQQNNIAYIDGANLHKGIQELGWKLDYQRFRILLRERYGVARAYLFIGLIPKNKALYTRLQEAGFTLVFKETTYDSDGKAKGNCDAELVLRAVRDTYETKFDKAVIVTGDGDFACLALFLLEKKKLGFILAPNNKKCSYFIRRIQAPIVYLNEMEDRLIQKEKAPDADGTA